MVTTKMAGDTLVRNEKGQDTRRSNMRAARAIADMIRTSLGPKGMDKMVQDARGNSLISNDGATIMNEIKVAHPTARMLVELSKAQDVEAGDGTTSVVVLAGAIISAAEKLLDKGVHPQAISEAFLLGCKEGSKILQNMGKPIDLVKDYEDVIRVASTSLNSKVVSSDAGSLARMAAEAVIKIMDSPEATNVDLKSVRVSKHNSGTIEESELVNGLVFTNQKVSRLASGPTRVENARVGLAQFCLSLPKTSMDNNIVVKDYVQMDKLLREERLMLAKMVKQIKATGCNVLLMQKSILRDAVSELAMDFLAKAKIMLISNIEREDVDFICRTLGVDPAASLDAFTSDKLGTCDLVEDEYMADGSRIARLTGVSGQKTVSVLLRGSNNMILDETERSFHDALCVVRSIVKSRRLLPGGGAPEMEICIQLEEFARKQVGLSQLCLREYAACLELLPYTLAENAGIDPITIVTDLRNKHVQGNQSAGINIKRGVISDMFEERVIQPLLVSQSALNLATETVQMILRIDDIVMCK
ncbi:MAG: hypothetical protein KVP17_004672 [Porospora cf. gigantea B]|uniref:uncharacterized protein n=2 Tax=Porospora cf. gigantea B TaxID=2853592 RepID=UPI003571CA3E|nr:MAG: hypothetical protein KVP17_004672 [Porospora cf. gigantea B]